MISADDFKIVANTVFEIIGFKENVSITRVEEDGVYASLKNGEAKIGAQSKIFAARSAMLLALNMQKGESDFEVRQMPAFDTCGVMLDVSSGAALRIDYVKKYLAYMAALGMNTLYFYMEDMFELEGYSMFGYMRGRYTLSELCEIDDYAYSLGIEVVPCIQTLAHMQHYLRWREAASVTDAYDTLLCDSEDTYKLIDDMVRTMRNTFRTEKINVGLDEAFNMGKGVYFMKNGYVEYRDIFLRHLNRIIEICEKYNFKPSMWSDMFFVLNSKMGKYNDYEVEFTEDINEKIPNVNLTYWEYDNTEEKHYDIMLKKHNELGRKVIFAGSVYTFLNFLPSIKRSLDATIPAMKACINLGIRDTFATVWGGDGAECPLFMSLAGLPAYSEYCYKGLDCTEDDIKTIMEFVTGFDYEYSLLISRYDNIMNRKNQGREILYGDIFWSPLGKGFDYGRAVQLYGETLDMLSQKSCGFDEFHQLSLLLFSIVQKKCPLFYLREPYCAGDKEKLRNAVTEITELITLYKSLWSLHKGIWNKYCKIFGWEVHAARYASMISRLENIRDLISEYLDGKRDKINELDEKLEDAVSAVPLPIYNRLTFTPFPIV